MTILIIVLIIFGYFLLAPFYFEIDSNTGLFRIRFHRIASARLLIDNSSLKVNLKIIAWKKQIDLLAKRKQKVKPPTTKKANFKMPLRKVKALLKSFKINKCSLSINTGNMPLNGILYPVFLYMNNRTDKAIEINFLDETEIILEIKNNLARMIRAYFFHK